MRKKIALFSIVLCSALSLGEAIARTDGASQVDYRRKTKMLEIGMTAVPKTADPRELWNFQHFLVAQCMYQTLVRVSESGRLVSDLAKRWEVDQAGMTYTFELNEKAVFHDGSGVTASDVAFSLARHFWPGSPSVVQNHLKSVMSGTDNLKDGTLPSGIKVLNEHSLQLTLIHPYPPMLYVLAMPGFSVVSKKHATSPTKKWIGSGPMNGNFDSTKGTWSLHAFDRYAGSKPKTNGIHIRGISGYPEIETLIKDKALDVIIGAPVSEVMEAKQFPGYNVTRTNSLFYNHLFYNNRQSLFKNSEFRRDLGHLIQSIAKKPASVTSFITYEPYYIPRGVMPGSYYQRTDIDITPDEFGKKWAHLTKGKKLHVVVLKNAYSQRMLDDFEAAIKKTGLDLQFDRIAVGEYFDILKNDKYDIITGLYVGNFPDPDGFLDPLMETSKARFGVIPSRDLFTAIEKVRYVTPAEKRLEEYSRILRSFEDNWYLVPLYRISVPIIHNAQLSIPDTSFRYEAELWNMFWSD